MKKSLLLTALSSAILAHKPVLYDSPHESLNDICNNQPAVNLSVAIMHYWIVYSDNDVITVNEFGLNPNISQPVRGQYEPYPPIPESLFVSDLFIHSLTF